MDAVWKSSYHARVKAQEPFNVHLAEELTASNRELNERFECPVEVPMDDPAGTLKPCGKMCKTKGG